LPLYHGEHNQFDKSKIKNQKSKIKNQKSKIENVPGFHLYLRISLYCALLPQVSYEMVAITFKSKHENLDKTYKTCGSALDSYN
jgi:hypothetical protein